MIGHSTNIGFAEGEDSTEAAIRIARPPQRWCPCCFQPSGIAVRLTPPLIPLRQRAGAAINDKETRMHWFAIGVAVLVALSIGALGILYLTKPQDVMRSFGLPLPCDQTNIFWWLRLKGSRDLASGLVVLSLVAWNEARLLGLVLLILAIIPFGDMSIILAAKGSKRTAFGIHGTTAALMVAAAGLLLTGRA